MQNLADLMGNWKKKGSAPGVPMTTRIEPELVALRKLAEQAAA